MVLMECEHQGDWVVTGQWSGNDQEISFDLYETSNLYSNILLDLNLKNKIVSLLWSKFQV